MDSRKSASRISLACLTVFALGSPFGIVAFAQAVPRTQSPYVPYPPVPPGNASPAPRDAEFFARRASYNLYNKARKEIKKGNKLAAIRLLQKALIASPRNAPARADIARLLDAQGSTAEALAAYRTVLYPEKSHDDTLRTSPLIRMRYILLSLDNVSNENWSELVSLYRETVMQMARSEDTNLPVPSTVRFDARSRNPQALQAMAHVILSVVKSRGHDYPAALSEADKAQKLWPMQPIIGFYKGYALKQMGRREEAKQALGLAAKRTTGAVQTAAQKALTTLY